MPSDSNFEVRYLGGTVDVPHLGITLRRIFGCASEFHDIERDGREVKLTLDGVYIGTIQLKDEQLKGRRNDRSPRVREDTRQR